MAHGSEAPGGIVAGVVVPGNDVHFLCPLKIIQELVGSHQVGGDRNIFGIGPNHITLHLEVLQHAVRHETAVINGQTCKCSVRSVLHAVQTFGVT